MNTISSSVLAFRVNLFHSEYQSTDPLTISGDPDPLAISGDPDPLAISGDPDPLAISGDPDPLTISGDPDPLAISGDPDPLAINGDPGEMPHKRHSTRVCIVCKIKQSSGTDVLHVIEILTSNSLKYKMDNSILIALHVIHVSTGLSIRMKQTYKVTSILTCTFAAVHLYVCNKYFTRYRGIKLFSCSTQLSTKLLLFINVKMPTIFGILTFISMINKTSERPKARNLLICWFFNLYDLLKFRAQLS